MSSTVTINRDRVFVVDGKPFFPIAARHTPLGATPEVLREVGFNCVRWTPFGTDASEYESFDVPHDFGGLKFYTYVYNRGDLSLEKEKRARELTALVGAVKAHPDLLCYEQRNEPAYTFGDAATPQSPPDGFVAGSALIRALDPNHPIRVGHMCSNLVSTLKRYNSGLDAVGCNPYVVIAPGMRRFVGFRPDGKLADCADQTLSAVGRYTNKMMRVAEGRAVWMQVQGSANENWYSPFHTPEMADFGIYEHARLYPNRWQMRFMAFDAIINGATGLSWMLIRMPTEPGAWSDVSRVVGELGRLHDVLASPTVAATVGVEYRELGFSDWEGVEVLLKRHNDESWLLAANTQFDPMIATFSDLPPGLGSQIEVVGEDRELKADNGRFTDRFQPYEVHVYAPAGRNRASGSLCRASPLSP